MHTEDTVKLVLRDKNMKQDLFWLGFKTFIMDCYRDKDIEYMTNTQWLVEIYNDTAHKSWL